LKSSLTASRGRSQGILRKLIGSSLKDNEKMIASAKHYASEQPPTWAPPESF